jgi:hypothetical protein
MGDSQLGDMSANDVAGGNLTKIHVSSDQAIHLLSMDVQALSVRLETLERADAQHSNERAALTRLITMLATEAHTVSEVQALLERQMKSDAAERRQRRRYLDGVLFTLLALAVVNVVFHIIHRVLRGSGAAKP